MQFKCLERQVSHLDSEARIPCESALIERDIAPQSRFKGATNTSLDVVADEFPKEAIHAIADPA